MVSTDVTESVAPVTFATVGLKSIQSRKSNCPVGSGSSGSTLAAVYVGMSSYCICPERGEYESTEKNSPAPCEKKSNTTSSLPLGTTALGFRTILAMS